ncbi:MAG: DUF4345 domain-containing protein [Pseudomonadales bacterium]
MNSRTAFVLVLKLMGYAFIVVGALHVVLGLQADQLLGANISAQSRADPGLDSQNRFYGAAFTLYGFLLLTIRDRLEQYSEILRCLLWVFWGAGLVRLISVAIFGWPPLLMNLLLAIELTLPLALLVWHRSLRQIPREGHSPG